jgi:uncharacterized coiled-coil DUF342 family protein
MALAMQDQRVLDAIVRIERALDRIEAANADDGSTRQQSEELERLRAAHRVLRSRVETAIDEIDRMLEPGGGAAG